MSTRHKDKKKKKVTTCDIGLQDVEGPLLQLLAEAGWPLGLGVTRVYVLPSTSGQAAMTNEDLDEGEGEGEGEGMRPRRC